MGAISTAGGRTCLRHAVRTGRNKSGHSWRWGYLADAVSHAFLGYLLGVTRERMTRCPASVGRRQPQLKDHPSRVENHYGNPFWNQTALMLTDQGHVSVNVLRRQAGGESAQWFGDQATLYMPNGRVHGNIQKIPSRKGGRRRCRNTGSPTCCRSPCGRSGHGDSAAFISAEFIDASWRIASRKSTCTRRRDDRPRNRRPEIRTQQQPAAGRAAIRSRQKPVTSSRSRHDIHSGDVGLTTRSAS